MKKKEDPNAAAAVVKRVHRLFAASTLLMLLGIAGCGGGGGGGGDGGGGTTPPTETPLKASAVSTTVVPYQSLGLTVKDSSGADAAASPTGMVVEMSSASDFSNYVSQLGVPSSLSEVVVAIPEHEVFDVPEASTPLYVRLRRLGDNALSNVVPIHLDPTPVSNAKPGVAVATLSVLNRLYASAMDSPALETAMATDRSTYQFDQLKALGVNTAAVERKAWMVLYGTYGVQPATEQATQASVSGRGEKAKSIRDLASRIVTPVMNCIASRVRDFENAVAGAEEECFETGRKSFGEDLPAMIRDVQDRFAVGLSALRSASSAMANRIGRLAPSAEYFDRLAQHFILSSETNRQMMLFIKGTERPGEAAREAAMDYVKNKLWDEHDEFFHVGDVGDLLLQESGYREKTEQHIENLISATPQAADAIKRRAQSLLDSAEDGARAAMDFIGRNRPDASESTADAPYGTDPNGTPLDSPACALAALGGATSCDPSGDKPQTVDEMCASAGGANAPLPLTSSTGKSVSLTCGQVMTAFSDNEFRNNFLDPLMEEMQRLMPGLQAAMSALDSCMSRNAGSIDACQAESDNLMALTNQINGPFDALIDGLSSNGEDKHGCPGGYTDLGGSGETTTCVHSTLVASSNTSTCSPGSYAISDKGIRTEVNACIWYSRDYFLADGTCRSNYSKVFFLEKDRCRWSQLPLPASAILAVNTKTGARSVLER